MIVLMPRPRAGDGGGTKEAAEAEAISFSHAVLLLCRQRVASLQRNEYAGSLTWGTQKVDAGERERRKQPSPVL